MTKTMVETFASVMNVADYIQFLEITNVDEALECAFHCFKVPEGINTRVRNRTPIIVAAQHAAIVAVAYQRSLEGMNQLAREFGKDHTTVGYIIKKYMPYSGFTYQRVIDSPELREQRRKAENRKFPHGTFKRFVERPYR